MDITRYTFQSPYPNQIQIGKPDATVKQESSAQKESANLLKNTNQTWQQAQTFQSKQISEVKATVSSLDLYA